MTNLPVKPGIDGLPTSLIPTDPSAFVDWFKNSFLPRWAANADVRNATPGQNVTIGGQLNTPGSIDVDVGITGVVNGTGLTVTETDGIVTVGIANTGVIPGSYTNTNLSVNAEGQITAAANGSSGGVAPFDVTPDTHGASPTGVGIGPNDEFESGTSIDITGSRYVGATPWTALNVGSGPTAITNAVATGALLLQAGATSVGSLTVKGYIQPFSGQVTYQAKVSGAVSGTSPTVAFGMVLYEAASTKCVTFDVQYLGSTSGSLFITTYSSPLVAVTSIANIAFAPAFTDGPNLSVYPVYLQIVVGATTISCSYSRSGVPGTFNLLLTFNISSAFTVAPDHIGLMINPETYPTNVGSTLATGIYDWFRRVA